VTEVAVIGAGNGGLAAAADLAQRHHEVRLFNRSPEPIRALQAQNGIRASGMLSEGVTEIVLATTSLKEAVLGAEVVVVVLPVNAHSDIAAGLADCIDDEVPVVLNPGHMCGSLHMRRELERLGRRVPIVEFGTLTYVSRSPEPGVVDVFLLADGVPYATVPTDDDLARLADSLFPKGRRVENPMEAWLWDVNMILHPPGMILGATHIESTGGEFLYYVDGMTGSVESVMRALDDERLAIAHGYGVEVPAVEASMATLGTADMTAARAGRLGDAVRKGRANATIRAPLSLQHRYLHEDIAYGLVPLTALGDIASVPTPVAHALTTLAEIITGRVYSSEGLTRRKLGLENVDAKGLLATARGEP
jgi:opine dehydrogenase